MLASLFLKINNIILIVFWTINGNACLLKLLYHTGHTANNYDCLDVGPDCPFGDWKSQYDWLFLGSYQNQLSKHCPPPRIETAIQMVSHDRPMGNTDWDIQVTATLLSSGSCSHTGIVGDRSTAQPTRKLEVMYSTRDARSMTLKNHL